MNDINISAKRIKIEVITLLVCLLISFIINIVAIFYYESPMTEVISSLLYVLIFAGFIYVIWSSIRIIKGVFVKLAKK
jgi:FtsH-binding integral membrane protein